MSSNLLQKEEKTIRKDEWILQVAADLEKQTQTQLRREGTRKRQRDQLAQLASPLAGDPRWKNRQAALREQQRVSMDEDAGLDHVGAQRRQRRREALLNQQRGTMDGNTGFHLSPEAVRRQRKEAALREQEETTMDGDAGFYRSGKNYFAPFDTTTLANDHSVWNNEKEDGGEPPKFSPGKVIVGGVQKGVNEIAHAGSSLLAFGEDVALAPLELLSGQELGTVSDDSLFNQWNDAIRQSSENIDARYAEAVEAGGFWGELLYNTTAMGIQLLPQAVAALLTGGGSVAAQTTAGLQYVANTALSPALADDILRMVNTASSDPQFFLNLSMNLGRKYDRELAELQDESLANEISGRRPAMSENELRTRAALGALGSSLLNAAIRSGQGIETLPDELRHGESYWRSFVASCFAEGLETTAAGVLDRAVKKLTRSSDTELFSLQNREAVLSLPAMAEDFTAGSIAGGIAGAGQIAGHQWLSNQEDFLWSENNADDAPPELQSPLEMEEPRKWKPYATSRPSYKKGQVEQVWENAKNPITGKVMDPSGVEITWDRTKRRKGQWDMGHLPKYKYSVYHKKYMEGDMTLQEFLEWYHDPKHYRPELPSTNRSHKYE